MWPKTVRKSDLHITWYNCSGGGGQHKNKHANACRMKHIPTGITSQCEDYKSRKQNQLRAFIRLGEKLIPLMKKLNKTNIDHEVCTDRIRTYHEPRGEVKDHRNNKKANYDEILDGKLDKIL